MSKSTAAKAREQFVLQRDLLFEQQRLLKAKIETLDSVIESLGPAPKPDGRKSRKRKAQGETLPLMAPANTEAAQ